MKTLQDLKNEVSLSRFDTDYDHLHIYENKWKVVEEAAKLFEAQFQSPPSCLPDKGVEKVDHDCEFFLLTDVVVHSCECDWITVSDNSTVQVYVPLVQFEKLQQEIERLKEHVDRLERSMKNVVDGNLRQANEENARLREALGVTPDFQVPALGYADSLERRMTSYHSGLKTGYVAGCDHVWSKYVKPIPEPVSEIESQEERIIKLINTYWKFDDNQQPVSSWHDKQDLIEAITRRK